MHTYQLRGFFSRTNGIFRGRPFLSLPFDSADFFLAVQVSSLPTCLPAWQTLSLPSAQQLPEGACFQRRVQRHPTRKAQPSIFLFAEVSRNIEFSSPFLTRPRAPPSPPAAVSLRGNRAGKSFRNFCGGKKKGILSATEREVVQKNGALASAFRAFAAEPTNTLDAHSLGAVGARNLMGMGFIAARVRMFGRPALSLGWTEKASNMCMVRASLRMAGAVFVLVCVFLGWVGACVLR